MFIEFKSFIFALLAALGSPESASEPLPVTPASTNTARCAFSVEPINNRQYLVAEITAENAPWSGQFHVAVVSNGANTINLAQSGAVNVAANQVLRVAQFGIGNIADEALETTCDLQQ